MTVVSKEAKAYNQEAALRVRSRMARR
jgi:hypothetical protein